MKKTLLTLAFAAMGTAMAATPTSSITVFSNDGSLTASAVVSASGVPDSRDTTYMTNVAMGDTGISISASGSDARLWLENLNTTWSNTSALTEINTTLGTSITAEQLTSTQFFYTGTQNSQLTNFSLAFGEASGYTAGTKVVLYIGFSGQAGVPTALGVASGLTDGSVTYALKSGDGFGSSVSGSSKDLVIARVEGTLDASTLAMTLSGGTKTGLSMIAIAPVPAPTPDPSPVVPEPATATLSLLALAGLAARRRRKH